MCGLLFHLIWAGHLESKILQQVKLKIKLILGERERRWIKTEIKLFIYYFNDCTDPCLRDPMLLSGLSLWFWIWFFFLLFIDNQGKCSAELSRKRDEITNFSPEDIWISFSCYQYRSYHQGRRKWRSVVSLLPNVNQGFTFPRSFDTLRTQWNRLCPEKGRGSEKSIYLKKEINSWIWYLFLDLHVFSNFKSSNHHLEIGVRSAEQCLIHLGRDLFL